MKGLICKQASDPNSLCVYIPARTLMLWFEGTHLRAEQGSRGVAGETIREIDVPTAIIARARKLVDVQKELDSHTGWAKAFLK